jgi:hypothetical protein
MTQILAKPDTKPKTGKVGPIWMTAITRFLIPDHIAPRLRSIAVPITVGTKLENDRLPIHITHPSLRLNGKEEKAIKTSSYF